MTTPTDLPCDRPQSLHTTTRDLLRSDQRSLFTIASESGVPFYWLRKFSEDRAENPSINRVQFLYEFLTQRQLKLN